MRLGKGEGGEVAWRGVASCARCAPRGVAWRGELRSLRTPRRWKGGVAWRAAPAAHPAANWLSLASNASPPPPLLARAVLFAGIFWTLSVASFSFVRLAQLDDPTFSIQESVGSEVLTWFSTFLSLLAAAYIIYLFALLVLAFRRLRTMRPSYRFVLGLSLATAVVILIGVFANTYTALRETSAAFLASFGAANLYVWTLLLLHLPSAAKPAWEAEGDGGQLPHTQLPEDGGGEGAVTAADVGMVVAGDDAEEEEEEGAAAAAAGDVEAGGKGKGTGTGGDAQAERRTRVAAAAAGGRAPAVQQKEPF
jgi:hypothetical protein